jgi:hypothetical protein
MRVIATDALLLQTARVSLSNKITGFVSDQPFADPIHTIKLRG